MTKLANISLSATMPLVMSAAAGVLVAGAWRGTWNGVPIGDEGLIVRLYWLAMLGQVPMIAYFAFVSWSKKRKGNWTLLGLQMSLWAMNVVAALALEYRAQAMVAHRIIENKPITGSELALRRFIETEQQGVQDDDLYWAVASYVKRHLPTLPDELKIHGALESLTFKGVDRIGWDIYDAQFDKGRLEWRIFVKSDGKVLGLTVAGDPDDCRSSEPYECRWVSW